MSPKEFIGREELRREIVDNLSGRERRHILLAAPRCCGKTSLLNAIKKDVQDSKKIVVMIDCRKEDPENTTLFLEKIFNEARRITGERHPGSVDNIDFFWQDPIGSFRELFNTIKDKFNLIILLLDDYDSLTSNEQLIRQIGKISEIDGYCLILAGEKWIDSLGISGLYQTELDGFKKGELIEYFNSHNTPLTVGERALIDLEEIVLAIGMITAGRPGAVEIFAECICKSYRKTKPEKINAKLINHRLIERVLKRSEICGEKCRNKLDQNWELFDSVRKQIISDCVDSINESLKK